MRQKVVDITQHKKPVKGRNIVLFVNDSRASRIAFDFLVGLIAGSTTPADVLHIMTSINTEGGLETGKELLETFTDPMLRFMTVKRDVGVRGGSHKLVDLFFQYTEERNADLVVLGSDLVRDTGSVQDGFNQASGGAASLGSVTLTSVKHLLRPMLIVKSTNKCTINRQNGVTEKVKLVLQVEPTVQTTVRYLANWLDSNRGDHVFLAKPNGMDHQGLETMSTRMMLAHFTEHVHKFKYSIGKRPLEGAFQVCLPDLAYKERAHIIALQHPKTRTLSPELRDLIKASPCAVMINKTKEANPIELFE